MRQQMNHATINWRPHHPAASAETRRVFQNVPPEQRQKPLPLTIRNDSESHAQGHIEPKAIGQHTMRDANQFSGGA